MLKTPRRTTGTSAQAERQDQADRPGKEAMDVRWKVLRDLLASPTTLLPTVGGLGALAISWAMGGQATLNLLGAAGILGGLGWAAGKLVFDLRGITNRAYQFLHAQQRRRQEEELDRLDNRLRRDRDSRTQECLRQLRELYGKFAGDVESGQINRGTHEALEIVEELFHSAVSQLEVSYQLWQTSRRLTGEPKEKILAQRDDVVNQVIDTTEHLRTTADRLLALTIEQDKDETSRLQAELEEAIRVAKRTEQRMAAWESEPRADRENS